MTEQKVARNLLWGSVALLAAAIAYCLEPIAQSFILQNILGIESNRAAREAHEITLWSFTVFLIVRLGIYTIALAFLWRIAAYEDVRALLRLINLTLYSASGLLTGFVVMAVTILGIVLTGAAHLDYAGTTPLQAVGFAAGWLANDFIGAAGEEILFRGLIFLGLRRLGGTTLALVGSALAFSLVHGANPGASTIWMMRLFAQGLLLAYAVVRTGTLWWSIAYHAGWNWASAPIFGAVGSGYTDQGHLMTLTPSGSFLITGGDVGPEGSIFAFVAVAVATGLLFLTTRSKEKGVRLLS